MKHQIVLSSPAGEKDWDQGLLIGNGRLGASILGQVEEETVPLNEETIWYGGPLERENSDGPAYLSEIRRLLMAGEIEEATFLARAAIQSGPRYLAPYLPAGNLRICYFGQQGEVSHYCRRLDIDRALAEVSYEVGGTLVRREYFVSKRCQVIAIRITSNRPLRMLVNLNRRPFEEETGKEGEDTIWLGGRCGEKGVHFRCGCRAVTREGTCRVIGDSLAIWDTREVVLYTAISSDFLQRSDYVKQVQKALTQAVSAGWETLLKWHLKDFAQLYDRAELSLGVTELPQMDTPQLLSRCGEDDRFLAAACETLFALGRYLLISSSSDCLLPATLQGIWNGSHTPPWESKYTININTQMNYWPAEVCNLSECHLPLVDLVERMSKRGQHTARVVYDCDGFVAHHNTNLWADTAPEGVLATSPIWPMGGAWLSLHLFEHYLFTEDENFLRDRALPVMELAVRFFLDYCCSDDKGHLLTGPSISPENSYRAATGQVGTLCMAPAMDCQILRELLRDYLTACDRLGEERPWTEAARTALSRVPDVAIGADGRILEWNGDVEEVEPGHRHISHLFALYPGTRITPDESALLAAARKTLDYRLAHGGGHTGWSCAWIICFFARLLDGEAAHAQLRKLVTHSIQDNLLDSHPPFQIDGNFGMTAAVAEMLVQSHREEIHLLPALPAAWPTGHFTGARLRGNIGLSLFWEDGTLKKAIFTAARPREIPVRLGNICRVFSLTPEQPVVLTMQDFI